MTTDTDPHENAPSASGLLTSARIVETYAALEAAGDMFERALRAWREAAEHAANTLFTAAAAGSVPALAAESRRAAARRLSAARHATAWSALEDLQTIRAAWDTLLVGQSH